MSLQGGWTLRPERRDVMVSLRWAAFLTFLFLAVYLSCNWITSQRADPYRLWFDWELEIPSFQRWSGSPFALCHLLSSDVRPARTRPECPVQAPCVRGRRVGIPVPAPAGAAGFERPAEVSGQAAAFRLVYLFDLPTTSCRRCTYPGAP